MSLYLDEFDLSCLRPYYPEHTRAHLNGPEAIFDTSSFKDIIYQLHDGGATTPTLTVVAFFQDGPQ